LCRRCSNSDVRPVQFQGINPVFILLPYTYQEAQGVYFVCKERGIPLDMKRQKKYISG